MRTFLGAQLTDAHDALRRIRAKRLQTGHPLNGVPLACPIIDLGYVGSELSLCKGRSTHHFAGEASLLLVCLYQT